MTRSTHTAHYNKASNALAVATFISRISGAVREWVLAFCFGASGALSTFFIAFRIVNIFRRVFGEEGITAGFAPFYQRESPRGKVQFFLDLLLSFKKMVVFLFIFLESFFLLGYWLYSSSMVGEVFLHCACLMPGALLMCLFGVIRALLQCHHHYFVTGIIPAFFNVYWIASVFIAYWFFQQPIIVLSLLLSFGFLLQYLIAHQIVRRIVNFEEVQPCPFSSQVKQVIKPLLLSLVSTGAMSINSIIDLSVALSVDERGPSLLSFAIKFYQLPLALFGITASQALISHVALLKEENDVRRLMRGAMKRGLWIGGCCSLALIIGAVPLLKGFFYYTKLSYSEMFEVAQALSFYAIGLAPAIISCLFQAKFQAEKRFSVPCISGFILLATNIILSMVIVFVFKKPVCYIALATAISAWVQCLYLYQKGRRIFFRAYHSERQ